MKNVKCARCVRCGKEYEAVPNLTNCWISYMIMIISRRISPRKR